jgi:hypothetical protein
MEPYEHLNHTRRRELRWLPRGVVFALIALGFELVDAASAAGYETIAACNGFFRGSPEPALERDGDDVRLSPRGLSAVAHFREYWLPQLRSGTVAWPTAEAELLLAEA